MVTEEGVHRADELLDAAPLVEWVYRGGELIVSPFRRVLLAVAS